MTATIVEHDNRAPLDAGFAARLVDSMAEGSGVPSVGIAGDANAWTARPAGQLWERVAEGRTINYDVYPWGCLNSVHSMPGESERGRAVCIGAGKYTGPILGRHVCGDHRSHGIIRAGERVR